MNIYNYDIKNYLNELSVEISFNKIFVDKIVKEYLPNTTEKLIFLEIGALHGNDSLYFKSKYDNSSVYAIEGSKEVYDNFLKKNQNNINTFNICIFNYNGNITYNIKKNNENGLLSGLHSVYDRGSIYGTDTEIIECVTLDTFCNNNNIDYIDVLKLDVEGASFDILNNSAILKKIKIMHIETEDYEFFKGQKLDNEVTELLINNNFKLICKTGYSPSPIINGKQYDSVWINTLYFN